MLAGGLVPHRPYLIVGPSGTGKTTLALQFLCEGVRRGERVLLVTLEEPPNEIRLNHRALAPDLDRVEVFDAIPDVMRYERAPFKDIASVREISPFAKVPPEIRKSPELTSVEVTITALEQMLRSEVVRRGYSRIAVDSLTALQYFCMKGFDPIGGAQTFLRFLSDLRTTTLLTVESPLEDVETAERMLARGEVRLFRWELDGVTVRAIGVEKFRGSSHDIRLHPYRIGRGGIDVNLAVTISRDTRQIVEPTPLVSLPAAAPVPTARPVLESISEEVRDLVALGVDVGPVRGALEAALTAARGGRTAEAVQQIERLASIANGLATSVAGEAVAHPLGVSPATQAYRRIAERADEFRVGLPPTLLPPPDHLEQQLATVLSLIGPAPARSEGPRAPRAEAPTPSAKTPPPPAPTPAATAPAVSGPPSSATPTAPAPPVAKPAPPAPGGKPSLPTPAPSVSAPRPSPRIAEPPPLPPPAAAPAPRPSVGATPGPPPARPVPSADSGTPAPPPLPTVVSLTPTPPVAVEPPGTSVPVPKRRRRAAPAKRRPPEPGGGEAPVEGTEPVAGPKPKRRTVRKRKAPPVVAATAEPLPASDAGPPSSPSPGGGNP